MKKIRSNFLGYQNNLLSAQLDLPDSGEAKAFAVFAHCFTCSKEYKVIGNINKVLTKSGIGVLRFDFTGLGNSEGDFADTNFTTNIKDLIKASDFLKEHYTEPSILIGHSLGGAAVLQASKFLPNIRAVVTIAAPYKIDHLAMILGPKVQNKNHDEAVSINIGGRDFNIKRQFFEDLKKNELMKNMNELDIALLVLHSPKDRIVNINQGIELFLAANHPKSFMSIDNADHLLSNKNDSRWAGKIITEWILKYII